jgi:hypothetical protein
MASGVVTGGVILGLALWLPVSHMSRFDRHNHTAPRAPHHSVVHHNQHHHQGNHPGHVHHRLVGPSTAYVRPSNLAALARHSDAVFEAKIQGAHARMYRGSPQPYRLYSFRLLAVFKGYVNPGRPIWQSTRGNSAQTRLEAGHTYLLATRNTPGNPYLVLRGPQAVIQLR